MEYSDLFLKLFYIIATIALIVKLFLNLKNIKYIDKNKNEVPKKFKEKISLEEHQKAAQYTITKLKFSNIKLCFHFALFLFWIAFGGLNLLDIFVSQFELESLNTAVLFFLSYLIISVLISIPENLYSTFIIEEKFGFNKTTKALFIKDTIKQIILSLVLLTPLIYLIIYLMEVIGNNWWIVGWLSLVVFQFLIIWAYPKWISPFFNKFSPLSEESLIHKIKLLSKKIDIHFKDYFIMNASIRSSHGNAYFTGFGKNKRIVFFDTLLESLEEDEVISVLAHELGHLKKKHILKSLILNIFTMGIGFYVLGFLYQTDYLFQIFNHLNSSSYMTLILFLFIVPELSFFSTPLMSHLSRKNEYEADEFAATYSSSKNLISALVKMYKDNSSSLTPDPLYSKFYYSHPPALERVNFLEKFKG